MLGPAKKDRASKLGGQGIRPWLVSAVLIVFALISAVDMPIEWVPSPEGMGISVEGTWNGASPIAVERYLASPIEKALAGASSLREIRSFSGTGWVALEAQLSGTRSLPVALAEIADRLAALRRSLPPGASIRLKQTTHESMRVSPGFMVLQLVGSSSPTKLRRLSEQQVAPFLLRLSGVASVAIEGGARREVRATLQPESIQGAGLALGEIRQSIEAAMSHRSFGRLRSEQGSVLLFSGAEQDLAVLRQLAIGIADPNRASLYRIEDLAELEIESTPSTAISRVDGKPAVTLMVDLARGVNQLAAAREIRSAVDEIRGRLPGSVRLLIADDRSKYVRKQLGDVAIRGGLGILLLLSVILWVFRSGWAVLCIITVLAVSVSLASILLKPLGLTLNVLTLAGLGLLVGLMVDHSVVIMESLESEISKLRARGKESYGQVCRSALRAVSLPLLGGTLTTCAALFPIVYVSGDLKNLLQPFAALAVTVLLFSLFVSTVLIPKLFIGRGRGRSAGRRAEGWVLRLLHSLVATGTQYPLLSILVLLLAVGLPTPLLQDYIEEPLDGWRSDKDFLYAVRYNKTIGSDFVRSMRLWLDPLLGGVTRLFLDRVDFGRRWAVPERSELKVYVKLPSGSESRRAEEEIGAFEREAVADSSVKRVLVRASGRVARMTVLFNEGAMKTSDPYRLRKRLIAHALQLGGLEVSISGLLPVGFYSGLGEVAGYSIQALGASYEELERISEDFAERLERYPRVAKVDVNAGSDRGALGQEVIRFYWGTEAASRTGIAAAQVVEAVGPWLWREAPDFYTVFGGEPKTPVRLAMKGAKSFDLDSVKGRLLQAGSDKPFRLTDHAKLSMSSDPPVIERLNQQYRRILRVYYRGPHRVGNKMLSEELKRSVLPPGYRLERLRSMFWGEETRRQLVWVFLGALGVVFVILAASLESWALACAVMVSLPLSWFGIALSFLWWGQSFAEGALVGVLLVMGIGVNNAILLVDRFRRLRQARPCAPGRRLALLALRQRLRPMWATTSTSLAGILPFLLIPDAGSFWFSLALTVAGGLLSSTLLVPWALVALLSWRAPQRAF